jgi:hypothetical protein
MSAARERVDADERVRRRLAAAIALPLNLAFLVALDSVMRPLPGERRPWARAEPTDVLQVRLIDAVPPSASPAQPSPSPVPPEPTPPVRPSAAAERPPRVRREGSTAPSAARVASPMASAPATPPSSTPSSVPAPQFYGRDGQVRVPEQAAAAEAPFPQLPIIPTEGNPFVHRNPLPYEPTRLDKYFPSVRETLGDELVRKATVQRSARTPWGTQITCTWVLFFGACGWGPVPHATIEELKAMRVELPPLKAPSITGAPSQ